MPLPHYYDFDTKSLASLGPKIWNSLPVNIKSAETFKVFKKLSKHGTENCVSAVCAHIIRTERTLMQIRKSPYMS